MPVRILKPHPGLFRAYRHLAAPPQPRPHLHNEPPLLHARPTPSRTFISSVFGAAPAGLSTKPQTLHAQRVVPYSPAAVFDVVADVAAYETFLPYCQRSTVTRWSEPDAGEKGKKIKKETDLRQYPTAATLVIGYGSIREAFESVVRCDPVRGIVDAAAGNAVETIRREYPQVAGTHVSARSGAANAETSGGVFSSLRTRWTISPAYAGTVLKDAEVGEVVLGAHNALVELALDFQFASPMYASLSSAVTPHVAGKMIGAFEKRIREVLGSQQAQ